MAVVVQKWLDEPIIVLKADTQVTQDEISDAWFEVVKLAQTISGSAHYIVDLRSTNAPEAVVSWLRETVKAMSGAPIAPLLRVSFVGTSSVADADAESWFETQDQALNHIRMMAGVATMST